MKEATAYGNGTSVSENAGALEEVKKSGKTQIIVPTAAQNAAMRKAMEPVYADVAKRVGKKLIDDVLKTTQGVVN
jgi:C4-dicarboxylate-binding protein DctP